MNTVHEVRDLRNSICGHLEILSHLATIGDAEIKSEVRYALQWITTEAVGYDMAVKKAATPCLPNPDKAPASPKELHHDHTQPQPVQPPIERLQALAKSMVRMGEVYADPAKVYTCVLTALNRLLDEKHAAPNGFHDRFAQWHLESLTPKPEGEAVTA